MSWLRARIRRDERGATLILAIAFLLVIGGVAASVLGSVTSGLKSRTVLDQVRNRQYAADAGVEFAVAHVRAKPFPGGPGVSDCGDPGAVPIVVPPDHYNYALNGVNIRIDCANKFGFVRDTVPPLLQRNVVFTACVDAGTPCTATSTIVRAQVNFQGISAITRTWVQSWSVNR